MKTTLILTVTTILSLGALALVRAQDDEAPAAPEVATAEVSTAETGPAETAPPVVAGIRTDTVVEQKLLGGLETVAAVPVASVFAEGDQFFVLARTAESATGFEETEVTLGNTDGINVEVTSGIVPGDEVVTVSVNQLRFPDFGTPTGDFCGVGGCGETVCDLTTGTCSVKTDSAATCKIGEDCEEGETCSIACADCTTCKSGTACAECPTCSSKVDLTITADEFFNGSAEVFCEPVTFIGRPPMFHPY